MIESEVVEILKGCEIHEQTLKLPPKQLNRKLFEKVDSVLENLGGKWKGNRKLYEFPYCPESRLSAVIETGIEPPRNPYAFFPTPDAALDQIFEVVEFPDSDGEHNILEPSAGAGAIASRLRKMFPIATIDLCEMNEINRDLLACQGFDVKAHDFLEFKPSYQYDLIVMNPPFSVKNDPMAWLTHFNHAWSMLAVHGVIVCITPASWTKRFDKKSVAFKQFVFDNLDYGLLPENTFKESGTLTDTAFVYGRKDVSPWRRDPCDGWGSWHSFQLGVTIENDYDLCNLAKRSPQAAINKAIEELREMDPLTPIYPNVADIAEITKYFAQS
jgi:hypothetical protein